MKLEITFTTLADLKKQLGDLLEDMEVSHIQSGFDLFVKESIQELPESIPTEEIKVEQPKQPRATRKPKVEVKEEEVVIAPIVAEVKVEAEMTIPNSDVPKNFYSESEFIRNFAQVINHLLSSKSVDQKYIQDKCMKYGIAFIYALSSDKPKMIQFYSELVNEGIVTKKGDY
jgi:hypothetical protein